MARRMRVERSIAGPVLFEFGDALNGFRMALSDQDAISLCDAIRKVVEQPTLGKPAGLRLDTVGPTKLAARMEQSWDTGHLRFQAYMR